jgi:hypothetical protein
MNTDNLSNEGNQQWPLPLQEGADQPQKQSTESNQSGKQETKKKHKSALAATSRLRSAVGHAKSHTLTGKPGDFAHSGTNISYEN